MKFTKSFRCLVTIANLLSHYRILFWVSLYYAKLYPGIEWFEACLKARLHVCFKLIFCVEMAWISVVKPILKVTNLPVFKQPCRPGLKGHRSQLLRKRGRSIHLTTKCSIRNDMIVALVCLVIAPVHEIECSNPVPESYQQEHASLNFTPAFIC